MYYELDAPHPLDAIAWASGSTWNRDVKMRHLTEIIRRGDLAQAECGCGWRTGAVEITVSISVSGHHLEARELSTSPQCERPFYASRPIDSTELGDFARAILGTLGQHP